MLPLLAIPLLDQAVTTAPNVATSFLTRPIDAILFDLFIWFGWIPIAATITWGLVEMWVNYKQGQYSTGNKFVLLAIDVPTMTEQSPKALENLFANLYGAKSSLTWKEKWIIGKFQPTFSFEIISAEGFIQFLVRTQIKFRDVIEAGIYAHYPDAEIAEVEDYAKNFPNTFPNDDYEMWGAEMMLEKPSYYPIRTYVDFEDRMTGEIKDPLGLTLEQMAKMKPGEHFWIQILLQPSSHDWAQQGVNRINELFGKKDKVSPSVIGGAFKAIFQWPVELLAHALDIDLGGVLGMGSEEEVKREPIIFLPLQETEETKAIYNKVSKIGLGTKIRILYVAKHDVYVKVARTAMVKGILGQYTNLSLNRFALFVPQVPKDDYFWMRWSYTSKQHNLMSAYQNRSWAVGSDPFFLNTEEIASLWHFPTIAFKAPLIKKAEARRAEPPVGLPITFEENTLPGYAQQDADEKESVKTLPDFPSSSHMPFDDGEEPQSTTSADSIASAQVPIVESPTQKEETFVPPNLPM